MKKSYDILTDSSRITEAGTNDYEKEQLNYRDYKQAIRKLQINFEQAFSELKENIDAFENGKQKKSENDIYMFTINNKQKIGNLENIYENGFNTLSLMKNYFGNNNNSIYSIEITRYCGIFEKFKIQLQNIKNTFDKTYLSYMVEYKERNYGNTLNCNDSRGININNYQNGAEKNANYKQNNDMNYVFKERNALKSSLNELDNMIAQGERTTSNLKNQNYNVLQQIKKMNLLNQYMSQIQKVLKQIKYYNLKKTLIIATVIAMCIFFFFLFV